MAETNPYLDVVAILQQLGITKGDVVADLGCGTGYFTFPAAKFVGSAGRVYSADVQKQVVENITARSKMEGLTNVIPVWTDLEIFGAAKKIQNESLDFAFLVNVFFQTKKDSEVMKEAIRMVKPNGRILVIDWQKRVTPFGPLLENRLDPTEIKKIGHNLNLKFDRDLYVGEYHWGLLFNK